MNEFLMSSFFCSSSSIFNLNKAAYWLNWDRLLRYTIIPCVYMYKTPVTILSTWIRWDQWTSHLLISFVSLQIMVKTKTCCNFWNRIDNCEFYGIDYWYLLFVDAQVKISQLRPIAIHTHCVYKFTLHFLLRLSFQWFVLAKFHNVKFKNPNRRQSQCLSSGWNRLWVFCATNVSR